MADSVYPIVDFRAVASQVGVNLDEAFEALDAIYDDVDARNQANTRQLDLPCHRGCDACCHESVFLTPLEFYRVWDWVQENVGAQARAVMIERALEVYADNQALIEALNRPAQEGESSHDTLARRLKFRCPLLGVDGGCSVYPVRELLGRLFGCSFNEQGGIYGCHIVGAHLGGKTITLLPARGTARRLQGLPFTHKRQVYPYYLNQLFGS